MRGRRIPLEGGSTGSGDGGPAAAVVRGERGGGRRARHGRALPGLGSLGLAFRREAGGDGGGDPPRPPG